MTRRRKTVIIVLAILAILAAIRFIPVPPPGLEISRETTYVTEPITADGEVDFAAAINARMSEGVTPETNAMIGLLEALGPGAVDDERVYELLGMEPLPEGGEYFVSLDDYVKINPPPESADRMIESFVRSPMKSDGHRWVVGFLNANREPLDRVAAAAGKAHLYYPILPGDDDILFDRSVRHLVPMRRVARRLADRAALRLSRGQVDEAWSDLQAVYRLANLLRCQRDAISSMVADAMIAPADRTVRLAAVYPVDTASVETLLALWRKRPLQALVEPLWVERVQTLQALAALCQRPVRLANAPDMTESLRREALNPNVLLRENNRWFDRLEQVLAIEDPRQKLAAAESYRDELSVLKAQLMVDDQRKNEANRALALYPSAISNDIYSRYIADVVNTMLMNATPRLAFEQVSQTSERRITEAVLVLRLYHDDHGEYPETLEALAPKYLSDVPLDPFTGKPLAYDRTEDGYLLRSLGDDGKDDGAQEKIRWRMPRAEDA